MIEFKPKMVRPGDPIKAEEWNRIQESLLDEIVSLNEKINSLKNYIDNMVETVTLTGLTSSEGRSFMLDEIVPGENTSYNLKNIGNITEQWVTSAGGMGDICVFGISDYFDYLYYWSGAENGDTNMLDISLEYVDGDNDELVGNNLYVNDRSTLSKSVQENPYEEYIYTKNGTWYRYKLINPNPEKEIRYIKFRNMGQNSTPRIGNVLQLKKKLKQSE